MYTSLISASASLHSHLSAALGSFVESAANLQQLTQQSRWQAGDILWVDADNQNHALLMQLCRGQFGPVRVIVMSGVPDDGLAVSWLGAGAAAYIHAFSSPDLLRQVLAVVQSGGVWIGAGLMQQLCSRFGQLTSPAAVQALPSQITLREKEVIEQLRLGKSNKEIARELDITERTVKSHLTAIFTKLQVADRVQLLLKLSAGLSA